MTTAYHSVYIHFYWTKLCQASFLACIWNLIIQAWICKGHCLSSDNCHLLLLNIYVYNLAIYVCFTTDCSHHTWHILMAITNNKMHTEDIGAWSLIQVFYFQMLFLVWVCPTISLVILLSIIFLLFCIQELVSYELISVHH